MRIRSLALSLAAALVGAASLSAQSKQTVVPMSAADIEAFAKVEVAISKLRDSMNYQLTAVRNKTNQAQAALRDKLQADIDTVLHHAGMTDAQYRAKVYSVSVDNGIRARYDSAVAKLTGAPLPGQLTAAQIAALSGAGGRGGGAPVAVPAGPAGTHIGHVVNSFMDTPMMAGLLNVALAEARVASQHATLATRNTTSLDQMKLHAGHVLNALDPSLMPMGPGQGYGVKKAATGVANHIDLAAKAQGASANIQTHATHIATAAKNTLARVDQLIALAQKVQASTSAAEAANLVSQMASLGDQLINGADANNDGRVTWNEGEGGLQVAQDHVTLMLNGEMK